jgi:hypothetical protein
MPDLAGLFLKVLEAIGVAKSDLITRAEALKAKYPDGDVPISELENLINQNFSAQSVRAIVLGGASDLKELLQTGKSAITEDPSALA